MGALLTLGTHSAVLANATIPAKDIAGAKDNALLKRYEGSFIVSYERESFTDFKVPLSPLERTDRRDLKAESTPTLTEIARMMKAHPKLAILVVGHTDNQGAYEYNIDLSRRRADAVIKALAGNHGIDAKRMRGSGVGMMAPAASNDSEEGRAKNRRVEIVKLN